MVRHARAALVAAVVITGACKKEQVGPAVAKPSIGVARTSASGFVARPTPIDLSSLSVPALFAHVPADTPYMIASFEAIPLEFWGKLKDAVGPTFQKIIDKAITTDPDGGGEVRQLLDVIREEMGGAWSAAGLERIGFSATPRFAMYGLGVMPVVFRLEVKDHRTVLATIERVAKRMKEPLEPRLAHQGREYWRFQDAMVDFIIALVDNQLVMAVGPREKLDRSLGLVLGTEKPRASMADGRFLAQAAARHGFGPHFIGFVDTRQLLEQGVAYQTDALLPACRTAIERFSERVPRAVFGYSPLNSNLWSGGLVIELAPDLVKELAALRVEVPGLEAAVTETSIVAFGVGMDLDRGRQLALRAVLGMRGVAEACEGADTVESFKELEAVLFRPLPAALASITGGVITVEQLEFGPSGGMPEKLDAIAFVTSKDGNALFSQLETMIPLGQLGVVADGLLHPVQGLPVPFPLHAGVGKHAVAISAGGEAATSLAQKVLAAGRSGPSPFVLMSYDYGRWLELELQVDNLIGSDDDEDELDEEFAPYEQELNEKLGTMYGRSAASLDVTDEGLVFWGTLEVK